MAKEADCVELGLTCAEVCQALDRGINGRRQEQLSQSVLETIEQLAMYVKAGNPCTQRFTHRALHVGL